MQITASMVKELREMSGAGMMDAKHALSENGGDIQAAMDWLRTKGMAKAAKKAGRVANQGLVAAVSTGTTGAMVEVNAETDFVGKNEEFVKFVNDLTTIVAESGKSDVEEIKALPMNGSTVGETLTALIAKIGENMNIRRATTWSVDKGVVNSYVHMGGKIGVVVALESDSADAGKLEGIAKNVAMHVAAANPLFMDRASVDQEALERERAIFMDQAKASGKPENIIEKIVEGRVNKYYEEVCLLDQAFIMETDKKVGQVIKDAGATLKGYTRFGLGEGIEKEEADFASEVAAAVAG